ncbi:LPP20 family lipoprotein [Corallococcus interemptor]|uniref:LPP20 family lipoprotein n=1 Tax=Corallococcus interemptor TaxID=2316720 RepID=UPI003D024E5E
MRRSLWGLLLVVPLTALGQGKEAKVAAPAAGPVRGSGAPGINWEGQVLRATGAGAPDLKAANPGQARLGAERAAKQDAFRNLMDQAKGIQVSAGRTVGDELARDEVKARIETAMRAYKVVATRYFSDSGVEMDVEVPLAALTAALTSAQEPAIVLNAEGAAKYTGLVVDARGLGAKPVLAPRLVDTTGKPLYGATVLTQEARGTAGVAAWFNSLDAARKASRVGDKPLVVKAAQLQGSDLVLSAEGIRALTEANTRFLAEGRVAIVTQ